MASDWPAGSETARRIREHDWAATPIGPVEGWPQTLRSTVDLMLDHGFPMIVLWGEDLVQIYNDRYAAIMADKHPAGLGQPTRECWPEVWHINGPIYDRVRSGETLTFEDKLYRIARHGPIEDAWFTLTYSPIRADGDIAGVLVTLFETTAQHVAVAQRAADLARVQRVAGVGGLDIDIAAGLSGKRSPEYLRLHGLPPDTAHETHEQWRARLHPDDREDAERALMEALEGPGTSYDNQYRIVRPSDGEVRWIHARADIERGTDGKPLRLVGAHLDVTEQRRMQETLRAGEERQRFLLRLADTLRPLGNAAEIEAAAAHILGDSLDAAWVYYGEYAHEPKRTMCVRACHVRNGGTDIVGTYPIQSPAVFARLQAGHAVGVEDITASPLIAAKSRADWSKIGMRSIAAVPIIKAGSLVAALMVADTRPRDWSDSIRLIEETADRTWAAMERARAEEALHETGRRLELAVAELQHRVRNILTVVRSVFSRTIEAGGPLDDISDHFKGRLDSLARTQVVVTQSASGAVDLENLIRDELLSVGVSDGPNLKIEGPDVSLLPKEAESIGLAIHELTTNALKYGALKNSGGKLDIRWTANMSYRESGRLNLIWTEQGVPAVAVKPSRRGFGSELIEEALPYQLRAETKLEFRGGGVRCSISIPLPGHDESAVPEWKEA